MQDIVVGQECSQQRHSLEVTYPITNGIVQKWDDMQHVWDHTFYHQLQVDPTECKILLTDPPLNPQGNRDRLLQTMFEHYGFAAAFIQIQAVLTLYAQGEQHCTMCRHVESACFADQLFDTMPLACKLMCESMRNQLISAKHVAVVQDC